jgi:DNA-directed RNA polymerase sigma subunit (sigma70/sigma32)
MSNRHEEDLKIWESWNKSKEGKELERLLDSLNPMIQKTVNKYSAAPIPRSAIESEAKRQAISAFKTFDIERGNQLNTHVGNYLQKVFRFVANNQNIARIPEHRVQKIQTYKNVFESLSAEKNREPTVVELSDELMWSPNEVGRLQDELRKDLSLGESFEQDQSHEFNRTSETLNFAYYSIPADEQLIYDYLTGSHGKVKLSIPEVAKKMRMDEQSVLRKRNKLINMIKDYSGGTL